MSRAKTPEGSIKQSGEVPIRCDEGVDERAMKVRA